MTPSQNGAIGLCKTDRPNSIYKVCSAFQGHNPHFSSLRQWFSNWGTHTPGGMQALVGVHEKNPIMADYTFYLVRLGSLIIGIL